MLGVETALAVVHTTLVEPGVLTLAQALAALSWQPARIAGLDATATAARSRPAPPRTSACSTRAEAWVVDAHRLASRSVNSPWDGLEADRQGPPHGPRGGTRPSATGAADA